MFRKTCFVAAAAALLFASVAGAQTVSRIRVMLHPYAATKGEFPPAARAQLESVGGITLSLEGKTRTGALDLSLAKPLERNDAEALLARLRNDRSVLWAEVPRATNTSVVKRQPLVAPSDRLLVRLADGVEPDFDRLLASWKDSTGAALTLDRAAGDGWVLRLPEATSAEVASYLAQRIQEDPRVQYADFVKRVYARRIPNDPLFGLQWALTDPISGINATRAWDISVGNPSVTVAVVDTGVLAHPDLAGRILPGYDFVSDIAAARDGDPRDPDATDSGDFASDNVCFDGVPAMASSWHGTFVAGIIAARSDNGSGISGIDWNAKILPVRVLGRCGGTDLDVYEGLLWAVGRPVRAVPPNPNPAKVINMSLGGWGACSPAIQETVDAALAQGAVVVVAAGNETDDSVFYNPANCSGVINVGAHQRNGERTSYSNYGFKVDISAPGGDGEVEDWIISLSNAGIQDAAEMITTYEIGTSFAAPHVAGTAALMLARNSTLTPGKVLALMQQTARPFPKSTVCGTPSLPFCGVGQLDAAAALTATPPTSATAPKNAVPVFEFYRPDKDQYFLSANPAEVNGLDHSPFGIWQRTGQVFYAYANAATAPADAKPVCRFYGNPAKLLDSHYFTAEEAECEYLRANMEGTWDLEDPAAFYVQVADGAGNCPNGTFPVYRFFNNKKNANHRYTIDLTVRRAMLNRVWIPEGRGPYSVSFCAPI